MTCTEVQRTLVKSPPELWAELSDPDALSRHLAELGEIRITSVEPECAVRWETGETTGSIGLKPSGWGTKVTLRVTRKTSARPPLSPASQPQPAPDPAEILRRAGEPGTVAPREFAPPPEPALQPGPELVPEPVSPAPPDEGRAPVAEKRASEPPADPLPAPVPTRRGFFARMFWWREHEAAEQRSLPGDVEATGAGHGRADEREEPHAQAAPPTALEALRARFAPAQAHTAGAPEPTSEPPEPTPSETAPAVDAELPAEAAEPTAPPAEDPPQEPAAPALSAELRAAEEDGAEEVTAAPSEDEVEAVLTRVLDRLGAAHHRPFSRA
jgi:hypothetical protein